MWGQNAGEKKDISSKVATITRIIKELRHILHGGKERKVIGSIKYLQQLNKEWIVGVTGKE